MNNAPTNFDIQNGYLRARLVTGRVVVAPVAAVALLTHTDGNVSPWIYGQCMGGVEDGAAIEAALRKFSNEQRLFPHLFPSV